MSRVTAPASKLARTLNTAANSHGSLHHSHGAVLMPKYAELLKKKPTTEAESHARGIATKHRPTPQPQPSKSHARPLMQTFSTTVPSSAASTLPLLPSLGAEAPTADVTYIRMPLLPDSFTRHNITDTPDAPLAEPTISVVAANPGDVLPASALTEVEGMGVDGVELRFAHEPAPAAREPGMITDLWRGLVEDITGRGPKLA